MYWSSGGGFSSVGMHAGLTERGNCARAWGCQTWSKQVRQPLSRWAALSRCLYVYVEWVGEENGASWLFCPLRSFFMNAPARRGNSLPPCVFNVPEIAPSAPRLPDAFSPGVGQCPECFIPAKPLTFKTPVFKPHWLQKTHKNQPLSLSQPIVLGNSSPCVYIYVFLPFSLTRAPSFPQHLWANLPQTMFHTSYLPVCGPFSPSSCAVCFVSSQIDFMGIKNDLIVI